MRRWTLYLVMILAVMAAWLLGHGLTGMVISQSCCFGPECDPAYVCDPAHVEQPVPTGGSAFLGLLLLIGAVLVHKTFHRE